MPTNDVPTDDMPARAVPPTVPPPPRPRPRLSRAGVPAAPTAVLAAAAADAACVLAFVIAGRRSHAGDGALEAVLGTAWPFLLACVLGWLVARAWRRPGQVWPTGVVVWAVTWVAGLGVRGLAGDGLAPAFVVVAGLGLAVPMLGWRRIVMVVSRTRRRRPVR